MDDNELKLQLLKFVTSSFDVKTLTRAIQAMDRAFKAITEDPPSNVISTDFNKQE